MMSDSEDDVRLHYILSNLPYDTPVPQMRILVREFGVRFDRWLREVQAEAWDAGFEEPRECPLRSCPWDNGGNGPTNPYREEN